MIIAFFVRFASLRVVLAGRAKKFNEKAPMHGGFFVLGYARTLMEAVMATKHEGARAPTATPGAGEKEHLISLLEKKRLELGEPKVKFGKQLGMGSSYYSVVSTGSRPYPQEKIGRAAALLGISEERAQQLAAGKWSPSKLLCSKGLADRSISCEDAKRLVSILEVAGKPLPLSVLLKIL